MVAVRQVAVDVTVLVPKALLALFLFFSKALATVAAVVAVEVAAVVAAVAAPVAAAMVLRAVSEQVRSALALSRSVALLNQGP